jgi:aspartate-semialdehyde dehydrogenase
LAPKFAEAGITVIDNSSAWRMDATKKLVVPEVNADILTKEEMKMVNETRKIIGDDSIQLTATCVRIPVVGGHSESVNVEFENDFDLAEVRKILSASPGVVVQDDVDNFVYPMPLTAHEKDETFVGRIRRDESQSKTLNFWVVSDNLRKGAATNAVQIAEFLIKNNMIGESVHASLSSVEV